MTQPIEHFNNVLTKSIESKSIVALGLKNGELSGQVVQLNDGIVILEVSVDRFNRDWVYIPVSNIQYIRIQKPKA